MVEEGRGSMFQSKSNSIPVEVVEKLIDIHYKHLQDLTERVTMIMGQHLEKVAALYERALNPPTASQNPTERMWVSETEEDEKYLSMLGELNSLKDLAQEHELNLQEFAI